MMSAFVCRVPPSVAPVRRHCHLHRGGDQRSQRLREAVVHPVLELADVPESFAVQLCSPAYLALIQPEEDELVLQQGVR